ncbi:HIT domain-containing protein [bacterium]|nr:HIT domain-containing protein [bacterium]
MDRLYTPWRFSYVTGTGKDDGCVFCRVLDEADDEQNMVLHRGAHWVVMLNRYPYNNGHLLLVLGRHVPLLSACSPEEIAEMGRLLAVMEQALGECMNPHGFNCGYNGGASAGAGIPEHLHLHLLPRWSGDTNFMTTVGETRILPQTLEQVRDLLGPAVRRLVGEGA